jgi:hypothetical protein
MSFLLCLIISQCDYFTARGVVLTLAPVSTRPATQVIRYVLAISVRQSLALDHPTDRAGHCGSGPLTDQ